MGPGGRSSRPPSRSGRSGGGPPGRGGVAKGAPGFRALKGKGGGKPGGKPQGGPQGGPPRQRRERDEQGAGFSISDVTDFDISGESRPERGGPRGADEGGPARR